MQDAEHPLWTLQVSVLSPSYRWHGFCCRIGLVAAKAVSKHKLKETYQKELQLYTLKHFDLSQFFLLFLWKKNLGGGEVERGVDIAFYRTPTQLKHNYIVNFGEGLVKALEHFLKRKIRMVEERGAIPRRLGKWHKHQV